MSRLPAPYTRISLGRDSSGRPLVVNARTQAMLAAAEAILGFQFTIVQGSYRGDEGAAASADTHARGGVVDLRTWNLPAHITPEDAVRALRQVGFAAWYRTKSEGFDPHIHAVAIGDAELHPTAAAQVVYYRNGRNGLKGNGVDTGPRVVIREFVYGTPAKVKPKPAVHLGNVAAQARIRHDKNRKALPGVKRIQRCLNAKTGSKLKVDGLFGPVTKAAYATWQARLGYVGAGADGIPGPASLRRLVEPKFRVTGTGT